MSDVNVLASTGVQCAITNVLIDGATAAPMATTRAGTRHRAGNCMAPGMSSVRDYRARRTSIWLGDKDMFNNMRRIIFPTTELSWGWSPDGHFLGRSDLSGVCGARSEYVRRIGRCRSVYGIRFTDSSYPANPFYVVAAADPSDH